ncbi:hypothetical protein HanRHA438_Chr16g0764411 [Helianthus annuus]|nr:hypothetical protein HanIR_Chr16g0817741 [Helianthus annuus]KAJ0836216.1 hypothetical protein HanRHA438_Chr16g0764411 [Helianthus annuus]
MQKPNAFHARYSTHHLLEPSSFLFDFLFPLIKKLHQKSKISNQISKKYQKRPASPPPEFINEFSGHAFRNSFNNICAFRFARSVQSLCTSSNSFVKTPAATASTCNRSTAEQSDISAPAAYSVARSDIFIMIFTSNGTTTS